MAVPARAEQLSLQALVMPSTVLLAQSTFISRCPDRCGVAVIAHIPKM